MRQAASLIVLLAALPAMAQEEDGFSLMDEGARLFMRGLMSELEPTLEELEGFAQEVQPALRALAEQMGPALAELLDRIDDIAYYEAPVILENGDILIRRRPDAPPLEGGQEADAPSDQIDL